jgi:predicted GNAT family acetyltransferase
VPDAASTEFIVRDNLDRRRYELVVDGRIVSVADYVLDGSTLTVPHVETDPAMRGQGMADRLMRGMLNDLRANERTVRPLCPFAADFVRHHPRYQDLVAG